MKSMPKKYYSSEIHTRYEGDVKPFWTQKEYEYQYLILNGFKVLRELNGYIKGVFPKARVDIYYDGPNGLGQKRIIGIETKVYKEATKFLSRTELTIFNTLWTKAKYEGAYNYNDPMAREDISDDSVPPWHSNKEEWKKQNKLKERNTTPLQDLFLTNNIDPKDVAADGGLSSLYNYIQGKRELPKNKAEEYARLFGVAPQTLMFDNRVIPAWGSVSLNESTYVQEENYGIGEIKTNDVIYTVGCPAEFYSIDVKAVTIDYDGSMYGGCIAYYYETDGIERRVNNKLCMIRTYVALEDEKGNKFGPDKGYYKYYLGIYQIYGTKVRILNPDPTSDKRILADDVDVDLAAPIVGIVHTRALENGHNLKPFRQANVDKIKQLIAEDEKLKKEQAIQNKTLEKLSNFLNDTFYKKEKESENEKIQKELEKQIKINQEIEDQIEKIKKELEVKLFKQRKELSAMDNVLRMTEEAKKRA